MSSWMNEAAAVQNHNGNGYPHMNDPNTLGAAAIMDPSMMMASPGQFNPAQAAQFNQHQMAAAMQNGPMRNASPAFQNPQYQTSSVIPSKRPRPREDSVASPRQNPGLLPTSRADTPQQFPGFQPSALGQPPGGPPSQQFSHLYPNGTATASPSPVMAGNQMRPGSVPQRVNTASPHPFSPASQQFGPQASPVPSEHGGTPQPNPYMQNQNMPPGFNPNFSASPSPARPSAVQNPMGPQMMPQPMGQMPRPMGPMPLQMQGMHPGQMQQLQMQHLQMQQQQMRQMQQQIPPGMSPADQQAYMAQVMQSQQQQQSQYLMAQQLKQQQQQQQQQQFGQGRGMMPKPSHPPPNGQRPPGPMPSQVPQIPRNSNPESFMKNLYSFMSSHGLPLDSNPVIDGRPVNLYQLFMLVGKYGYYRSVAQQNGWGQIAAAFGFPPQAHPSAPMLLKGVYERNLLKFEGAWVKQRSQQINGPAGMPAPGAPPRMGPQGQMMHGQPIQSSVHQPPMPQSQTPTPMKPMPSMPQAPVNGFSTPQHPQMANQHANTTPVPMRNSVPPSMDGTPLGAGIPTPSPVSVEKPGATPVQPPQPSRDSMPATAASHPGPPESKSNPDEYIPCSRGLEFYGGFDIDPLARLGNDLEQWRPDVPPPMELGWIDIQALTRSLQSGIHGEVRLALDTLGTVTREAGRAPTLSIELPKSDDLLESLIDCAEEQVDALRAGTLNVSDEIDLTSYEDIMRTCRVEQYNLQKVPLFGDADYELNHAVDRLIAITTILCNLSFNEPNQPVLADESVIKFLCGTIRYLGTYENLLRSPKNILDFMKDVVVLLSNISGCVELPGREQAFCLLQFLLAFAPTPTPTLSTDRVFFPPYDPKLHGYLPNAVDSLAKLLARDEPNRTHYKAIFAADAASSPPYELITRAFALAICSIPDQTKDGRPASLPSFVESRKPILMQGLLASDIIAQLAPGFESGLTRAWLSSSEGFAQNLLRLVRTLCEQADSPPPPARGANSRTARTEDTDVLHIITWGVSTLRRLTDKARDPNDGGSIPPSALPTKESMFIALQMKSPKWTQLLNHLSSFAGLGS